MLKITENIDLAPLNSFAVSVRGAALAEFVTDNDLVELFRDRDWRGWYCMGGGNNILFTRDYPDLLIRSSDDTINVVDEDADSVTVRAGAGVDWEEFVIWAVDKGLWGTENLSMIPGTCGAAPVQNIGAYGTDASSIIRSVETFVVDSKKKLVVAAEHCGFSYRNSIFKNELKGKVIITGVNFTLSRRPVPKLGYGDLNESVTELGGPSLENIRRAVIDIRSSKLPDPRVLPNAGSFFQNPVVDTEVGQALKQRYTSMPLYPAEHEGKVKLAAGWLIDQCGWKGRRIGDVGVHEKQALVIVNYGNSTGEEIIEFSRIICEDVKARFGIELRPEVNIL